PYQDPEGNGTLVDGISRDGYHSYEVSVRNVGASSVGSTELSIETDPTVPEDHTTHVELDKHTLTDIPADGDEIVLVNVSGQGASIGTVLRFILWAETGGDRYSMAFAIEIVPFRSVSLNSTYRKEGGDWRTDDVYAYPGEEVEFKVTVKNTSPDEEDRFNITFSPQEESGWTLDFSIEYGEILHLDVGESDVFYVNVTAPSRSDIPDGPFTITITAHAMDGSVVNESVAETWRLITNAVVGVGITGADTETASADTDGDFEEVEFEFEVDNQYDEAATLMFSVSSPSGWKDEKPKVYVGSTPTSSKLVPAPDPITLKVKVRPTLETAAGDYEFELKVQKDSDIYETKKFTLTLEPMILFKLKPESKEYTGAVAGDGSVLIISVDVFNKGNYKENVTIKASIYTAQGDRELLDWPISVATSNVDPAPQGAGREINITLTIPRDVETGEYVLVLMVEDSDGEEVEISGEDEITIFVEAPMGQMVSIALSEMWLQLLLFVGVIVLALMAARKKNSGQVSG
ncbi:MAG: hypothetical protein KAT70_06410, partial [Thermoplasmata archaeon]|nr:hypothetical protein [Thermoplasmata archaeon]